MLATALSSEASSINRIDLARAVFERSVQQWGEQNATDIVGLDTSLEAALRRVARFAASAAPVLITGETGTGKELFAKAMYLLSPRFGTTFLSINCAQYQEGQLIASELFGHKRGAFTGALTDHKGIFESAQGGVVFLDEIGELSLATQAMLLRLLGEGEIVPVGETRSRKVDVRVIAATHRDLKQMVAQGRFRADLYYRLRYLHLPLPALRQRGEDWRLILEHQLRRLTGPLRIPKRFSHQALTLLSRYSWPGNIRELRGLVDCGFHLSDGEVIEAADLAEALDQSGQAQETPAGTASAELYGQLLEGVGNFWTLVHEPFLDRELKRGEVRELISRGLDETRGSYKRLLALFGIAGEDYLKFMDFLRHHKLKPQD